jgi:hypothetical protein
MRTVFNAMDVNINLLHVNSRQLRTNRFYIPLPLSISQKIRLFQHIKASFLIWLFCSFIFQSLQILSFEDPNRFSAEENVVSFFTYIILAWTLRLRDFTQRVSLQEYEEQRRTMQRTLNNIIHGLLSRGSTDLVSFMDIF